MSDPEAIAVGPDGNLYITDHISTTNPDRFRIRRIAPCAPGDLIETIVELQTGSPVYETGPINDLAFGPDGSLFFDTKVRLYSNPSSFQYYDKVRRLDPQGNLTDYAGGTTQLPYSTGDGGTATLATFQSNGIQTLSSDRIGNLYVGDAQRVRVISPDGIIRSAAGLGPLGGGRAGDGGPASVAQVDTPAGLAVAQDGKLYLSGGAVGDIAVRSIAPPDALTVPESTDVQVPAEDGSQIYVFDASGRHLRTVDALTGVPLLTFQYGDFTDEGFDHVQRVTGITDADGNVTQISRDGAGHATAITGPFGQTTALTLDSSGYLSRIEAPGGIAHQFSYDTGANLGLMTLYAKPSGSASSYEYDALGRLTRDVACGSCGTEKRLTRSEIDETSFAVDVTTALGRTTRHEVYFQSASGVTFEPKDVLHRIVRPAEGGSYHIVSRSDDSELLTMPGGTKIETLVVADPRFGMLAPITKKITSTLPSGLSYDVAMDRQVAYVNGDPAQGLASQTDTLTFNNRTYSTQTTAGPGTNWTETWTSPQGRQTVTLMDPLGRTLRHAPPGLHPRDYVYDAQGRVSSISVGPSGNARATGFDYYNNASVFNGYLSRITDPLASEAGFNYDAMTGRLREVVLPTPAGATETPRIQFQQDADGNVTSLVPPGGLTHQWQYDPHDQLVEYRPPIVAAQATTANYAYTDDGETANFTWPDGRNIELTYDSKGRTTALNLPGDGLTYTYTYDDSKGQLLEAFAPDGGGLSVQIDGLLPTQVSWQGGSITGAIRRAYDANSVFTSWQVNNLTPIAVQFDADGLLTQTGNLAITRDPGNGLITASTLGRTSEAYHFNGYMEVEDYQAALDGAAFFEEQITGIDAVGRITQKTETFTLPTGTEQHDYSYTYDALGQLTRVVVDGDTANPISYSYDLNGNRLGYTPRSGPDLFGIYDEQDRLTNYGANSYQYHADGTLRTKTTGGVGTTTYNYDALNNLRGVSLPDGREIAYVIDAAQRRIGKKVNGQPVAGWLYGSGFQPWAELDAQGEPVTLFLMGGRGNVPVAMRSKKLTADGSFRDYRLVSDHLGSVRMVADAQSGEIVQRLDYDEFGRVLADSNPGFQPFGFAGGLYDPDTGLVRFGYRDYDPEVGRWTAKDPFGFAGGDPNLYVYVFNDPVNLVDPLGMEGWKEWWHTAADIAGVVEPFGIVDGLHAAELGLVEGRWGDAGMTAAGMIPLIGDLAKVGKEAKGIVKGAEAAGACVKALSRAEKIRRQMKVEGKLVEGIYEFTTKDGLKYVGQSDDIARRIGEHMGKDVLTEEGLGTLKFTEVKGGALERRIAEQKAMNSARTRGEKLANQREALNRKLRNKYSCPAPGD